MNGPTARSRRFEHQLGRATFGGWPEIMEDFVELYLGNGSH